MSAADSEIVWTARQWIGTPYHHQMTVRGAGCDCLGLVRGVWRDCVGPEPCAVPAYTPDWSEPQGDEILWRSAREMMIERPIGSERPGDVLLFRMRSGSVAKHLGIVAEIGPNASFIHAYQRHGVVESPLSAPWQRCIVSCFAFPI